MKKKKITGRDIEPQKLKGNKTGLKKKGTGMEREAGKDWKRKLEGTGRCWKGLEGGATAYWNRLQITEKGVTRVLEEI